MENQNNQVMSVKDWFLTIFVTAIPLVGLIMLFVWAFGNSTNASRTNWAKAVLLWYVVIFVLYILIAVVFGAAFLTGMTDMDSLNY